MTRATTMLLLFAIAGCTTDSQGSCVSTVPSMLLHEILCGQSEAPQGICLAEVDNGF